MSQSIRALAILVCSAIEAEGKHMVPDPAFAEHILTLGSGLLGKRFDDHDAELESADADVEAHAKEAAALTTRATQAESKLSDALKIAEEAQKRTTVLQEQVTLERAEGAEKDADLAELSKRLEDAIATAAALQKRIDAWNKDVAVAGDPSAS